MFRRRARQSLYLWAALLSLWGTTEARADDPLAWRALAKHKELLQAMDARMASMENLTIFRGYRAAPPAAGNPPGVQSPGALPPSRADWAQQPWAVRQWSDPPRSYSAPGR